MGETVASFSHVSKRFRLGQTHDSLRDLVANSIGRLLGRSRGGDRPAEFWALRDVNFDVARGEPVGIIGPNGAGKSTALRLLAGILRADAGDVRVRGRLAALIEVGAGFHGDLTGRENVFLNGAILGMDRAEIRSKLDAIVAFAGLERFLDTPVKRYSSGMHARLGFSIAAHVDPEILLVDEVLSVGDAVFRLRCVERMRELVSAGTTLVFVTHNLDQMQAICPRAIVLQDGRSVFDGPSRDAVGHYLSAMSKSYIPNPTDMPDAGCDQDAAVELMSVRLLDKAGGEVVWARSHDELSVELRFRLHRPIARLVVELNMRASASENLLSLNTGRDGTSVDGFEGEHTILLTLPTIPVCSGQYFWNIRMWDADRGTTEVDTPFSYPLVIDDGGKATGALCLEHAWTIVDATAKHPSKETIAEKATAPALVGE